ncbi:MAG: SRPBCC domain-containing protein [Asticcacaulis sp.]
MLNPTTLELEGDCDIVIRRRFAAPARIVFDAYSRPDLVMKWWAPKALGVEMISVEANVKVGGRFRYVIKAPNQNEAVFSGDYTEVEPHTRLSYTQLYEPMAHVAGPAIVVVNFSETDGHTDVIFRETYPSQFVRDAVIGSGMEAGMRNTFDLLEELVIELAKA